ncbi:MAG: hypothetical protein ACK4NC_04335 [Candidatus Gracilibacteria bacterium]
MKIYFTCSTADFFTHKNEYFAIRETLLKHNHILTRDWLIETEEALMNYKKDICNVKDTYSKCVQALRDADLVIIEDTVSNFSTGHQITLALQYKRPTLVLWKKEKPKHFKQMFIHGVESEFLEIAEYDLDTLEQNILTFISKYAHAEEKNRFHLVLNGVERQYLDWSQFNKSKSRTTLIREALKNMMNNDQEYSRYLYKGEQTLL